MKNAFKQSIRAVSMAMISIFVMIIAAAFVGESSALYDMFIALSGVIICVSPLLLLSLFVTGIGTLIQQIASSVSSSEKRKRYADPYTYEPDSKRMRRILAQLPPEDREFLQQELATRKLGLSDDGEMVALNDLLDEYDNSPREKHKRD